jgi:hypothetical protein
MAQGHKDYSGTPLWKKLGIREGARVVIVDAPEGFTELLGRTPPAVELLSHTAKDLDVAVLFATRAVRIPERFGRLASRLDPAGRLWLAWPKKAAKIDTDITFEIAQGVGLDAGLVDNKSASITDVYQGLQFVYRLKDRPVR